MPVFQVLFRTTKSGPEYMVTQDVITAKDIKEAELWGRAKERGYTSLLKAETRFYKAVKITKNHPILI